MNPYQYPMVLSLFTIGLMAIGLAIKGDDLGAFALFCAALSIYFNLCFGGFWK